MRQFVKKHNFGIIMFLVISMALVLMFLPVFAVYAKNFGVSVAAGQIVIGILGVYVSFAMCAFIFADME